MIGSERLKIARESITPPGDLLLDTSIIIEHFRGDRQISGTLEAAKSISVPSIVIGELYYGALRSANFEKQRERLTTFLRPLNILSVDQQTAFEYGRVRFALTGMGAPIPENDIWIAALAIQHRLRLAARDQHFARIPAVAILPL